MHASHKFSSRARACSSESLAAGSGSHSLRPQTPTPTHTPQNPQPQAQPAWLTNLGSLFGVRAANIGSFAFGNGANGIGSAAEPTYPGNAYQNGPVGVVDTTTSTQALAAGGKSVSAGGWFNKAITPKVSTGGLFVAGSQTLDAKYKGTTVMETPEKTYQYQQVTVIQKQEVIRKKGYCIPRIAAQLNDAQASGCPANTYLVNNPQTNRQVWCGVGVCVGGVVFLFGHDGGGGGGGQRARAHNTRALTPRKPPPKTPPQQQHALRLLGPVELEKDGPLCRHDRLDGARLCQRRRRGHGQGRGLQRGCGAVQHDLCQAHPVLPAVLRD